MELFEKDRASAKRTNNALSEQQNSEIKLERPITGRSFDQGYVERIHGGYCIKTPDNRKIIRKTYPCKAGNEHIIKEIEVLPNNKGFVEKTDIKDTRDTITFNTIKRYTPEEWYEKCHLEEQERREKRGYLGSIGYTLGLGKEAAEWREDARSKKSTLPYHATKLSEPERGLLNSFKSTIGLSVTHEIKAPSLFEKLQSSGALDNWKKTDKKPEKDAQAPGVPTKEDGFKPPKKWDGRKRKHPKTGQYGYPDSKGRIWVPSGPEGHPLAHGGPHWDVVDKNGDYDNILPGGKIRGQKCEALKDSSEGNSSNVQRSSFASTVLSSLEKNGFTPIERKSGTLVRTQDVTEDVAREGLNSKSNSIIERTIAAEKAEKDNAKKQSEVIPNISEKDKKQLKTMAASIDKETRERLLTKLQEKQNEKNNNR